MSARGSIPLSLCWIEVLWVSGAAGDWEEELNQASFVDQLSLAELCHSKLGPLHPGPGEVLTCKWRTESSKAPWLLTKMLQGPKMVPWDVPLEVQRGRCSVFSLCSYHRLKRASESGIMVMIWTPNTLKRVIHPWYRESLCEHATCKLCKTHWNNVVGAMNKPDYDTLFIPWEDWWIVVMGKRNMRLVLYLAKSMHNNHNNNRELDLSWGSGVCM